MTCLPKCPVAPAMATTGRVMDAIYDIGDSRRRYCVE